jgi:hypothetical protein
MYEIIKPYLGEAFGFGSWLTNWYFIDEKIMQRFLQQKLIGGKVVGLYKGVR